MFTCQVPVLKNRKILEMEVDSKRRNLMKYKEYFVPKDNECVRVMEAEKTRKEEELKNCYWIQCMLFLFKFLLQSIDIIDNI